MYIVFAYLTVILLLLSKSDELKHLVDLMFVGRAIPPSDYFKCLSHLRSAKHLMICVQIIITYKDHCFQNVFKNTIMQFITVKLHMVAVTTFTVFTRPQDRSLSCHFIHEETVFASCNM